MGENQMKVPASEEGWPQTIHGLNNRLAANDPENLLAANDGIDDPGEPGDELEPRTPPGPNTPKSGGEAIIGNIEE